MKTSWKHAVKLAVLLTASAGPALGGDKYEAAFTRSAVSVVPDYDCPNGRFTAPHPVVDTLGTAVATFTGCLQIIDATTVRFLGGVVTFVYTDGATSTATCEEWNQVPIHSCAVGSDHPFRCTFTGGTGRLAGIAGFFDVQYFDNDEVNCGGAELLGSAQGHVRVR